MKYIDAHKLLVEIDRQKIGYNTDGEHAAEYNTCRKILDIITSLQMEPIGIEKEAEIDPSMVSNFGPCAFNLSVVLTQEEMAKMNITPFFSRKVNVIVKNV